MAQQSKVHGDSKNVPYHVNTKEEPPYRFSLVRNSDLPAALLVACRLTTSVLYIEMLLLDPIIPEHSTGRVQQAHNMIAKRLAKRGRLSRDITLSFISVRRTPYPWQRCSRRTSPIASPSPASFQTGSGGSCSSACSSTRQTS